jgi:MSHA biogenesis protein MshL
MKKTLIAMIVVGLTGCASSAKRDTYDLINAELKNAAPTGKASAATPSSVSNALLPPLQTARPTVARPIEERFSVAFNNVPAAQFFTAIAAGTRYNVLVHPGVTGAISANLKDVTLFEALDAIRELYGYDYTVDGSRIVVRSPDELQSRIFHINYLNGNRVGTSETRVSSGTGGTQQPSSTGVPGGPTTTTPGAQNILRADSSKVRSTSTADFWADLKKALETILGIEDIKVSENVTEETQSTASTALALYPRTVVPRASESVSGGRTTTFMASERRLKGASVVVNPQSGVIVVRATLREMHEVEAFLKASQLSIERQVILEAKILEVQLNDSFQSGVNWASFASIAGIRNNRTSAGFIAPGTSLASAAQSNDLSTTIGTTNVTSGLTGNSTLSATTSLALSAAGNPAGSIFGFAFQTNNFATLLTFLETQGTVHVLSSPRIATLNNQKAILKVGTDDFFVTNVSSNTNQNASTTSTTPEVTLQQFFSGVVLDVTPQIDEDNNITLHVHPSVTQVSTQNKLIDLGSLGRLNLPLASSNTSETDSVVRGGSGQVIAIGGLMRQATTSDNSQVPGAGDVPVLGGLFRSTNKVTQKRELVILIKPTVVQDSAAWDKDVQESQRRMQSLDPALVKERK